MIANPHLALEQGHFVKAVMYMKYMIAQQIMGFNQSFYCIASVKLDRAKKQSNVPEYSGCLFVRTIGNIRQNLEETSLK
ncbi:MAG: hypothetical protein ACJASB_004007 [Shewanella psychromarinicola]|jgi:hypothetical protein